MRANRFVIGAAVTLALGAVSITSLHGRIGNRIDGTIVSSGEKREYLLYVPRSYDAHQPTPLVVSMHGAAGWPSQQMAISRWNELADANGFIVVYPAGSGVPKIWHVERGAKLTKDVHFISELIDTLEAEYNIDPARIYANGLSNGGGMTFVLSCTLSDRIAAVGTVAAAQTLPFTWCTDQRPVPVIAFHGSADPLVPYQGGPLGARFDPVKVIFPPVRNWMASWARRNRCAAAPVKSGGAVDVTRLEYTNCADDADVVLYTVKGGGHTWPGGQPLPEWWVGPTSHTIDASSRMWAFFREHPLQRK